MHHPGAVYETSHWVVEQTAVQGKVCVRDANLGGINMLATFTVMRLGRITEE